MSLCVSACLPRSPGPGVSPSLRGPSPRRGEGRETGLDPLQGAMRGGRRRPPALSAENPETTLDVITEIQGKQDSRLVLGTVHAATTRRPPHGTETKISADPARAVRYVRDEQYLVTGRVLALEQVESYRELVENTPVQVMPATWRHRWNEFESRILDGDKPSD